MDPTIIARLSEIVGENDISTSPLERTLYGHDAAPIPGLLTRFFKTTPDVIVRPESADEVARILCLASDSKVPVIPRAAASWSLGGVIPVKGGIVLDLIKLNRIREVSRDELWVEVEAGVVWQDLMEQLLEQGLTVLSYPTSAPSSTVGGWVSTGGYGIGSLKYGHIGQQIEALEVVTPGASGSRTDELPRRSLFTGLYNHDPRSEIRSVSKGTANPKMEWFLGTEGQFGVITRVKLRIRKHPDRTAVRGVCATRLQDLADLVGELTGMREVPYCVKVLDSGLMALRRKLRGVDAEDKNLVLAVFDGSAKEVRAATAAFDQIVSQHGLEPIAESLAEAEWEERYYPMRIGRLGPTLLGGETIVPLDQLGPVLSEIRSLQEKYHLEIGTEAHVVSKGWAVVLALYLADERKALRYMTRLAVIRDIVHIGLTHGGKPYGLGLWDAVYVRRRFGRKDLQELKRVKKRLDPNGIMNPGKFFRADTRFGIPIPMPLYATLMNILSLACRFL